MLNSLKRLTKHSAIYGIGHITTRLVNFLLLPVYTNQIPADEFGVYAVVYMYLAFMTIVYTYGLDAAFLRFFVLSEDTQKRRQIFSTAFWAVVVVGSLLTAIIYLNAATNSRVIISEGLYPNLFRLVSLILLFDALTFLPFLYLRAEEKSLHFVTIKFVNVLINVGLNIYFVVHLKKGVEGILLANVLASAITFALLLPILWRHVSFVFVGSELKELLRFGLPYLPSTLSIVALDLIDRFFLERLVGLEVTGIYSAGYRLGIFMNLFVAAFRFAWHPFFLSTSKQENAKEVFAKILTYFVLIASGIFLMISFFVDELVRFEIFGFTIFGEEYWESTKIVPVILLCYLINGMYVNFIVGIYLEKQTKYLPIVTGAGAIVNILANLLLIPLLGMMGAAYAKFLAYAVMAVCLYLFAQKFYAIHYEFGRLLKLAVVAAGIFYFGYFFQTPWQNWLQLSLVVAFPLILFLTGFFERRELENVKKLFGVKIHATSDYV
ncbi:oligosaccharide flippase family protein [candidate division KSB1 bacterium]|nr:oligosaccharide flippase family protein [candidate division KSB1 bacterium]